VYSVYTYMYMLVCKYSMHTMIPGVLLLYTANTTPYVTRVYATTQREFQSEPLLEPKSVAFLPEAPLLYSEFQVDNSLN